MTTILRTSLALFLLAGCYSSHATPPPPDPHVTPCPCVSCHESQGPLLPLDEIPVDCQALRAWFPDASTPDAGR